MEHSNEKKKFGAGDVNDYKAMRTLGEGAYGIVYKGENVKTGDVVALKKIKLETQSEGVPSTTIREISVLREIQDKNVVGLKDVIMCPNKMYLVMEYLDMDLK